MSKFDLLYRKLVLTKFFTKGWGKPENLKRLFEFRKIISNRETCQHLVSPDYPVHIDKRTITKDSVLLEGHFTSPFVHYMPDIMPEEVQTAWFQVLLPLEWRGNLKPICLHLAGTGDHYFWRRRILLGRPLLKEAGIASILLENPYYGLRKPKSQIRSSLHNVSDLFVMGGALVLESLVLLHWCERQGYGPLGLSGVSMGGHMASLAATNWHKPLSIIPCLSWSTASHIFTQGVMSGAVSWSQLQQQYMSDAAFHEEIAHMVRELSPDQQSQDAFALGQHFARNYPSSLQDVVSMQTNSQNSKKDKLSSVTSSQNTALKSAASNNIVKSQKSSLLIDSFAAVKSIPNTIKTTSESIQATIASVIRNSVSSSTQTVTTSTINNELRSLSPSSAKLVNNPDSESVQPNNVPCQCADTNCSIQTTSSLNNENQTIGPFDNQNQMTSALGIKNQTTSSLDIKNQTISSLHNMSDSVLPSASSSMSNNIRVTRTVQKSTKGTTTADNIMQQVALDFMRGAMDECTHIGNFSRLVDPELAIVVVAEKDAYVPRDSVLGLDVLWPGAELRYVDSGHITAYLFKHSQFRQAIIDAMNRQAQKYYKK